jgi:hypothetical protein
MGLIRLMGLEKAGEFGQENMKLMKDRKGTLVISSINPIGPISHISVL